MCSAPRGRSKRVVCRASKEGTGVLSAPTCVGWPCLLCFCRPRDTGSRHPCTCLFSARRDARGGHPHTSAGSCRPLPRHKRDARLACAGRQAPRPPAARRHHPDGEWLPGCAPTWGAPTAAAAARAAGGGGAQHRLHGPAPTGPAVPAVPAAPISAAAASCAGGRPGRRLGSWPRGALPATSSEAAPAGCTALHRALHRAVQRRMAQTAARAAMMTLAGCSLAHASSATPAAPLCHAEAQQQPSLALPMLGAAALTAGEGSLPHGPTAAQHDTWTPPQLSEPAAPGGWDWLPCAGQCDDSLLRAGRVEGTGAAGLARSQAASTPVDATVCSPHAAGCSVGHAAQTPGGAQGEAHRRSCKPPRECACMCVHACVCRGGA